jgi:hypothetical protein
MAQADSCVNVYEYSGYNVSASTLCPSSGKVADFGYSWQFDKYCGLYEDDLKINNYAGSGNHDYENSVNNCWENGCAMRVVNYLEGQVKNLNI